jgi:drug/metabolite transporter (DMT)-like permease
MNALVKWTSAEVDVWTTVFVRSLVIAFAIYIIARIARVDLVVHDRKNMAFRCFTGLAAMILYFSALGLIPIGQAVTLQYTNPLFVALLSGFFLSERVHPQVWALAMVSFLGIVLIVSPDLRTIEKDALFALGSGFFAGVAYLYVRRLKATEEALSIVFWFAAFSVVATALPAIPSIAYVISDPILMLALVGIGVGAGAGQVGLTYAFHRANAAWVSAFSYLTVIVATAYGYLLFDEILDTRDIIGGIMIICSGIILSLFQVGSTDDMAEQE